MVLIYRELKSQKNQKLSLEIQIIKKTKELERLNNTLEEKIIKEVEKNRQKDVMLFQQSKMASMGEMIANIAHQWRQPLAIISTLLAITYEKSSRKKLNKKKLRKKLLQIEDKVIYMSETIEDFLNYFKLDNSKTKFFIYDVIDEITILLKVLLKSKNIKLNLLIDRDIYLYTYKGQMKQVIISIFTNSIQAFGDTEDKTIEIKAIKMNNSIKIFINDNAGGIDDDIVNKIFDPYYTTKQKEHGVGLGLYMAKTICENNINATLTHNHIKNGAQFILDFNFLKGDKNE